MLIRSPGDFWGGLLFVGLGAVGVGSRYALGSAARMGPGYFPRILGILLIVLGIVITLRGVRVRGEAMPAWKWCPTLIVLGSVVLIGVVVAKLGVAISTVLLIVAPSTASHEFRAKESVAVGVFRSVLAVSVFIVGLHLQLPTWPAFMH